jgi:hypothetical protein
MAICGGGGVSDSGVRGPLASLVAAGLFQPSRVEVGDNRLAAASRSSFGESSPDYLVSICIHV